MENRIPRIWAQVEKVPWAILPEKLDEIIAVLHLAAERESIPIEAVVQSPKQKQMQAVAVLPLFGIISQRANIMSNFSGGTSTELFAQAFRQLYSDPSIGAIVIEADSPGGNVPGVPELAAEIFNSRGKKPIITVANPMAGSAAYWIGSAADEIVVTPSGTIGSIGILAVYSDRSSQEGQDGVIHRVFSAGKYKDEMSPHKPLSPEASEHIQSEVYRYNDMFTAAVARHRGVKQNAVESGFGQGRMVGAKDAVRLGMADRVATLDETVVRLMKQTARPSQTAVKAEDAAQEMAAQAWLPPIEAAAAETASADPVDDEIRRRWFNYL